MSTITPILPSGGSNGRGIKLASTATTIHTATSTSGEFDRIRLWVYNSHTAAVACTIECGGSTSPDDLIKDTIPPGVGLWLMIDGIRYNGGVVIKGYGATTNVLTAHAQIDRYAP